MRGRRAAEGRLKPAECVAYVVLQVASPALLYGAVWLAQLACVSAVLGGGIAAREVEALGAAWRTLVAADLVFAAAAIGVQVLLFVGRDEAA